MQCLALQSCPELGLRGRGLFRVRGLRLWVWGLGVGNLGSGFWGLGLGLGLGGWSSGFGSQGLGSKGSKISGLSEVFSCQGSSARDLSSLERGVENSSKNLVELSVEKMSV